MSTNEFDKMFAAQVSKATLAYNPGDWAVLTRQLAAARRKKRAALLINPLSGMAAAVVLFCVILWPKTTDKPYVSQKQLQAPAGLVAANMSDTNSKASQVDNAASIVKRNRATQRNFKAPKATVSVSHPYDDDTLENDAVAANFNQSVKLPNTIAHHATSPIRRGIKLNVSPPKKGAISSPNTPVISRDVTTERTPCYGREPEVETYDAANLPPVKHLDSNRVVQKGALVRIPLFCDFGNYYLSLPRVGTECQSRKWFPEELDSTVISKQKALFTNGYTPNTIPETMLPKERKKISYSLAGGVNYGNLNAGYTVGALADKPLSKKFKLEVLVAFINNNGTRVDAAGNPFTTNNIHTGTRVPQSINTVSTPLNYLQFAPVAGYNIGRRITVGAGADIQRLLDNHDVKVVYQDYAKLAPMVDLGMLLKTDYLITNHIMGGVSYRMGVTDRLQTGNNYIDRSYMQVQLKYRLAGRASKKQVD